MAKKFLSIVPVRVHSVVRVAIPKSNPFSVRRPTRVRSFSYGVRSVVLDVVESNGSVCFINELFVIYRPTLRSDVRLLVSIDYDGTRLLRVQIKNSKYDTAFRTIEHGC